jgi:putative tryptophan/tyrosine transport system substrate-binding protein
VKRRAFIAALGGAAAWPLGARAQQSAVPVVGFLSSSSPAAESLFVAAFVQGLKESGYVEGQNVAIEYLLRYSGRQSHSISKSRDRGHRLTA